MFHQLLGYDKPKHPLITLIDLKDIKPKEEYYNKKYVTEYYTISLKNGRDCAFKYGRKYYDFSEGSLMFTAPGQVAFVERGSKATQGWMLCFHPDLIRGTSVGNKMEEYTFFSYDASEALHLSENEKQIITTIVHTIEKEYSQNIDIYSHELIVSNIEVLLNYSKRFYGRQFITRANVNKDVISQFDMLLKRCFDEKNIDKYGIPSVKDLAKEMGYSANYLGDLLKKETGKSTQEHIQFQLLEKAKSLLLGTEESVTQISYILGFEYPAHFSKFFKSKTGISPAKYRKNA
jgi:AraC-like DNA-binding protein